MKNKIILKTSLLLVLVSTIFIFTSCEFQIVDNVPFDYDQGFWHSITADEAYENLKSYSKNKPSYADYYVSSTKIIYKKSNCKVVQDDFHPDCYSLEVGYTMYGLNAEDFLEGRKTDPSFVPEEVLFYQKDTDPSLIKMVYGNDYYTYILYKDGWAVNMLAADSFGISAIFIDYK